MDRVRVRYSKTGKAKYISHLDLMTTMQRAFLRAGIALKYSDGFNPHPYISVALPLSVGAESTCELMDAALHGGTIGQNVNDWLPEGLKLEKAYRAWRSFNEIKWIDLSCLFWYKLKTADDTAKSIAGRFMQSSLIITKKTKRGQSLFDAAAHIKNVSLESADDNSIKLSLTISAQNPTISYKDITNIIAGDSTIQQPDAVYLKRIEIYDTNMVLFK